RGVDIDYYSYRICRNALWEKKRKCYWKEDSIEILPRSLHIFYEMLFSKLIGIDRDGDIILTRFSDKNMENSLIDLNEYYNSEYSETESESSDSEIESEFSDSEVENVPLPVIS
ncbi:6087_t:CDS:1, partial [Diversispora eburnea]